jgi:hypothetical protein
MDHQAHPQQIPLPLQDFQQVIAAPLGIRVIAAGIAAQQLQDRHRLDHRLLLLVPDQDPVRINVVVVAGQSVSIDGLPMCRRLADLAVQLRILGSTPPAARE